MTISFLNTMVQTSYENLLQTLTIHNNVGPTNQQLFNMALDQQIELPRPKNAPQV